VQLYAAWYCINLTYTKLTETQTSRTNFATVQTVQTSDFIIKVIECPIPFLLIVIMALWCKRNCHLFYFEKK